MTDARPNFILIMTDQQRGDALSIDGHPVLQTPQMDEIGGAGVRFRRAYSTCPVCIPARRSLMSGQFAATHGLVGYRDGLEWEAPPTLPGVLREAGYETSLVGRRMHLHPPDKRYGFSHMNATTNEELTDHFATGPGNNDWTARPWHLDERLHHTHQTVDRALEFLKKRDPSCPYFLVVSFLGPHPPLIPPASYFDYYMSLDLPAPVVGDWAKAPEMEHGMPLAASRIRLTGERLRRCQAGYFGLIHHIDDQMRRLLNPVGSLLGGNTYVAFTSDHGEMLGDHHCFRKSVAYEGSARIPLMIRGPHAQAGTVCEEPVCLEDIMPTFLELGGCDIPDSVEGRSLAPLLRGEDTAWRSWLHGEHCNCQHYLTDGKMKYLWHPQDGREQLFDLVNDPGECHEVSDAEATALWRGRLVEHLKDRPEGFSDGQKLIAGRPYASVIEGR